MPLQHLPWQRAMNITAQIKEDFVHRTGPGGRLGEFGVASEEGGICRETPECPGESQNR